MGTSIRPERRRLTPEQYRAARKEGYSDEEIKAKYDLPDQMDMIEDQYAPTPKGNLGEALTYAQGIPIIGPFTDEIAGSIYGALSPSKTMKQGREAARGLVEEQRKEHPIRSLAGEMIVGGNAIKGLATAAPQVASKLFLNALPEGASYLQHAAQGAKAGALMGAAAGAGNAEGADRLTGAATGGAGGAVFGGVAAPLFEGASRGGSKGLTALRNKMAEWKTNRDPEKVAIDLLRRNLEADQVDLMKAAQTASPDDELGDVAGRYTQAALRGAAKEPTKEGHEFFQHQQNRVDRLRGTTQQALAEGTGVPPTPGNVGAVEEVRQAMVPEVQSLYDAAYAENQFLKDPRIDALLRSKSKAMRKAVDLAEEEYAKRTGRLFPVGANGERRIEGLEVLDEIKKALDRLGARNPKDPSKGLRERALSRQLTTILDDVVRGPEYAQARALHQQRVGIEKATEVGGKLASSRAKDVRDAELLGSQVLPKSAPQDSREMAQVAQREAAARTLMQRLNKAGSEESALQEIFGSPNAEAVARTAFPDDRSFAAFVAKGKESLRKLTQAKALQGNAEAAKILDPDTFGRMTPWAVAQALQGSGQLAAAQFLGQLEASSLTKAQQKAVPEILRLARTRLRAPNPDPLTGQGVLSDEIMALFRAFSDMRNRGQPIRLPRSTGTLRNPIIQRLFSGSGQ